MTKIRQRSIVITSLLILMACGSLRAPAQEQTPLQIDVNLVMIDATVKDKSGKVMDDLKKEDFEVREDGGAQKLTVFSRDELPLDLALVLDLSDSIGPFLGPLRDAANTTLAALKPQDRVALFTFATDAQLRVPLTTDKRKIADEIASFKAGGATNINDGIFVASEYLLKNAPMGRHAIILISDDVGTDAGGQGTRDIVTETLAADATVYNLKIPGYNPSSTLFFSAMTPGLVDIHKVTEQTGGEIFDVKNVSSLTDTFSALIQRIKTRYTLGYYTAANGAEGKPHRLEVRLAPKFGKNGKNYTILAKSGFFIR